VAAAAAFVATNDPAAPGSAFPQCVFRTNTGLWCPGCGLTRGFHQLFNGHLLSALQQNVFVPIVFVVAVAAWWSWVRVAWGRPALSLPRAWVKPIAFMVPAALIVYGVLRNIPHAPFTALAP
jgi:hypothetical protein